MTTQAQDQSEIFNGTASVGFKDKRSADGSDTRAIPAFVFGEELADLAETDPRIVVLTADLGRSNRALDFAARHPGRFFNAGIAEKNMVTVSAGLAACGYLPFAATFGSFASLLCAEQIRTDCAYPNLPVRIVGHHSGMSMGFYGTSHHSLEDIAMMRSIAGLAVVSATDANHLRALLRLSVGHAGAMYLRLGRGRDPEVYATVPDLVLGQAHTLRDGSDLTIIATGSETRPALDAAALLAAQGISARVVDMWTISPLDREAVRVAAAETGAILTVEEANVTGGLGSAVAEVLADDGLRVPLRRHGVPDEHVPVGPPAALYAHYRLDAPGIAAVAQELLKGNPA
ncbi:transketolase family protein [Amycolatopsis benzoatilytica]|uniref:transketolase family protein n=1 Tax=Amycolatopsis benzoatilytica TaxID=346045 RepID=UPI000381C2D9|nr:transketolase C-terminal domain-containing protein [Amycolatopsis benzoatilytica]